EAVEVATVGQLDEDGDQQVLAPGRRHQPRQAHPPSFSPDAAGIAGNVSRSPASSASPANSRTSRATVSRSAPYFRARESIHSLTGFRPSARSSTEAPTPLSTSTS